MPCGMKKIDKEDLVLVSSLRMDLWKIFKHYARKGKNWNGNRFQYEKYVSIFKMRYGLFGNKINKYKDIARALGCSTSIVHQKVAKGLYILGKWKEAN